MEKDRLVYALEEPPEILRLSIYLVGPTPRSADTDSWRPEMIEALEEAGFDGTIFVPESRNGERSEDYQEQAEWEQRQLDRCDAIVAWVPRDLENMPAFTTNVEFGRYVESGRMFYGRPDGAPHTSYLDWIYEQESGREPEASLEDLALVVTEALQGRESERRGGERCVPIHVWESEMFRQWYLSQLEAGNRLDGARVLWTFFPKPGFLLAFSMRVNVWVKEEDRNKSNEFIFSRRNIATVLPIWRDRDSDSLLDSKVVMIREFRSSVQNGDSFVHELPGGSEVKEMGDAALGVAAAELKEETGLDLPGDRFVAVAPRQLAATTSTHQSYLFLVELSDEEIELAEKKAHANEAHGKAADSERTYVEVSRVGELLKGDTVDFSTLGMIMEGVARIANSPESE